MIYPNIRGSSGFGRAFEELDNGLLRENAVKDIGALLDWIAAQPGLDKNRVMIAGPSYGGYVALAAAIAYGDRLRGVNPAFGITDFPTFLETTEMSRQADRNAEYGDPADPEMRAFLTRISPLTNVARLKMPVFIAAGAKDTRVPISQAETMVKALKAQGHAGVVRAVRGCRPPAADRPDQRLQHLHLGHVRGEVPPEQRGFPMRIMIAVALLVAGLLSAPPALAQQAGTTGPLAEAEKLLASGDVRGAISSLERIVGASPRSFDARLALGRALDLDGRHADARRHLEEALKLAPDDERTDALTALGVSYAFEAKADEAARYYQRAFDADVQRNDRAAAAGRANALGRIYLESGNLQKAEQWYTTGYEMSRKIPELPASQAALWEMRRHNALGRIEARRGNRAAANEACRGRQGPARHARAGEPAGLLPVHARLHRVLCEAVSAGGRRAVARGSVRPVRARPDRAVVREAGRSREGRGVLPQGDGDAGPQHQFRIFAPAGAGVSALSHS